MSNIPGYSQFSNIPDANGMLDTKTPNTIAWGPAPTAQPAVDLSQLQLPVHTIQTGDGEIIQKVSKRSPQYQWLKRNAEALVHDNRTRNFWLGLFLYIVIPASVGFWVLTPGLWFSLPGEPVCPAPDATTISKASTVNQPRRVTISNTAVAWALFIVFLFVWYYALASFGAHFPFHITDEL